MNVVVFGGTFWDVFIYGNRPHDVEILELPGGSGLNIAFGLYKLGHSVCFFSNIGNDWRGTELLKKLSENGLSTYGLTIREGKTGYHIALNDTPIGVDRGVNRLNIEFDNDTLKNADIVVINSEIPVESIYKICSKAEKLCFIDLGPRFVIDTSKLRKLSKAKLILIGNEKECEKEGCDVIKMGSKGASWKGVTVEGDLQNYPFKVGAGDIFDVVLIDSFLKGLDKRICLERAVTISQTAAKEIKGAFSKMMILEPQSG
ncbi:PfkB family carbohydrate kinase [Kosmotoga olearia]|uniref:PfkB domain protein n=1 Tax=Kosmotoga olearia (strain ATCC BAA-1733 / DSM 21960 / TBF 19.5.1) TaxID=521045 RepID=C5CEW6_KOSOT|nr:PfkB family carbohydrate kinase [Kosmotoga olearia]ACR79300.1 PfkB domain protein [Kosmotoga olearia TBF 19.5.1]